jgi:hypothetical protein
MKLAAEFARTIVARQVNAPNLRPSRRSNDCIAVYACSVSSGDPLGAESNRQVLEFVLEAGIIYLVIGDHHARSKLLKMWQAAPKAVLDRLRRRRRSV